MYICERCKGLIDVGEFERTNGDWLDGYYMGDEYVCPHCGHSECVEAIKCESCGEYVSKEEAYGGYCEKCVNEAATPENVAEWCNEEDETETVEINTAVKRMCESLGIDINDLLTEVINESAFKDRIKKSCEETVKEELDTEYFMNWWIEKRG